MNIGDKVIASCDDVTAVGVIKGFAPGYHNNKPGMYLVELFGLGSYGVFGFCERLKGVSYRCLVYEISEEHLELDKQYNRDKLLNTILNES